MNADKIAERIAKNLVGGVKDLGEIKAILPEMHEKQKEYSRQQEENTRKMNEIWGDMTRELDDKTDELSLTIKKELESYFKKNGMGVRTSSGGRGSGLIEVFIGSSDGEKRIQSKVSTHIALTFKGRERYSYMLRNEELDVIEGNLSDKNTVAKLLTVVKKADKSGFWKYGE